MKKNTSNAPLQQGQKGSFLRCVGQLGGGRILMAEASKDGSLKERVFQIPCE